jgi:hypothetical protein
MIHQQINMFEIEEEILDEAPAPKEVTPDGDEVKEIATQIGGMTSYWRLESVDREALINAWQPIGFESHVPKVAPVQECLRHAMKKVCKGSEIKKVKDGYRSVSWDSSTTEGDYTKGLIGKIETLNGKKRLVFDPPSDPRVGDIFGEFKRLRKLVSSDRLRYALLKIIQSLNGMTLAEDGHIYFVPEEKVEKWRAVVAGARAASTTGRLRVYQLTTVLDDGLRVAAQDALEQEIADKLSKCNAELERGDLSPCIIRNRTKMLEDLTERVAKHKKNLGVDAEKMTQALKESQGHLVMANFQEHKKK